jgi:peptidoglycan DL-endopeptidase LytF
MNLFTNHKLIQKDNEMEYELILYLDHGLTEISDELGNNAQEKQHLRHNIFHYIQTNIPKNIPIKLCKVMLGTLLITSVPFGKNFETEAASNESIQKVQIVEDAIKIELNGKLFTFSEEPLVIKGTTYVPIRDVSEALGANVTWDQSTKTVFIRKGNRNISFKVGDTKANVDQSTYEMKPSLILNHTTMVPLRFVSEALKMNVKWDASSRKISITSSTVPYIVQEGESLWTIAKDTGTTVDQLKRVNQLEKDNIEHGQQINVSTYKEPLPLTYTVKKGDTLNIIARRYDVTVQKLVELNQLSNENEIQQGQVLRMQSSAPATNVDNGKTIEYVTHKIESGDNMWALSVKYGVPQRELLKVNGLTESSSLSIGQIINVPVHHIPVKETVSANHGEYVDWWSEAQYLFPISKVVKVTDFKTGRSFMVKRTIGANHADCEPLTAQDASIMKEVWGGTYSWDKRAVIIHVDDRKLAASMTSFPHGIQYITDNGFDGHFDIHFKNSTTHKDGLITASHQSQIKVSAGMQ